jgi:hypothetical protein
MNALQTWGRGLTWNEAVGGCQVRAERYNRGHANPTLSCGS